MSRLIRDDPSDLGFADAYAAMPDVDDPEPWLSWCREAEGPVLYVGPGAGRIAVPLWRAGVRLVGVDRHPAMVVRLRERLPAMEVVEADFTSADLGGRRFDLVIGPSSILTGAEMLQAAAGHSRRRVALQLMNPHWLAGPGRAAITVHRMTEKEAHIEVPYAGGAVQEATVTLRWPERIEDHLAAAGLELEWMGGQAGGGLSESSTYYVMSVISPRRDR